MTTIATYKIAVLLTCFNRKVKTLACLNSLYNATLPTNFSFEVFLVDDGSSDGTTNAVNKNYPEVNVIKGSGNLFWSRGMNLAWKTAAEKNDFDFFLWLNDDVTLMNDSLTILLNDYNEIKNIQAILVGACKSMVIDKTTYSGYKMYNKGTILNPNQKIQECDFFNGNIVLISSNAFKKVGYIDSIYHHAQGDFDYGLRASKLGIKSYVTSKYVGYCERNKELPVWCNPNYSILKRWKNFKSPLGGRPRLTFIFQKKYIGIFPATFHYFTIHLRMVFPRLWKTSNP